MPRRRIHRDDPGRTPHEKSTVQAPRPESQAAPGQLAVEDGVWERSPAGQAEMLANPNFQPAQRSFMAAQIGQLQGNRHLAQVLSSGLMNGHFIQRSGDPAVHPTVRFGSTGTDVEDAQAKLNTAGAAPPLEVDGIFGSHTRTATVEFQGSHSLSQDGVIGPLTWAALDLVDVGPDEVGPDEVGPDIVGPDVIGPEVPAERWPDTDMARLTAQASDTGPLNQYQATRAELRVYALTDPEYSAFRSLLNQAASDMEWAFLLKAAAAQRSITDITAFAERIRGMSDRWLMRNLMVVDLVNDLMPGEANPEERGIMQQYGNSCGPTSVQLIHAQADPIYALELRSAGPIDQAPDNAVSNPETIANQQLANEQAGILNAHVATGGRAPTNRTNPTGGAWVESDMNALAAATGVTYETKIIGTDISMEAAISALQGGVATGVQVPIIVGGVAARPTPAITWWC
jgi:hypothetical protein